MREPLLVAGAAPDPVVTALRHRSVRTVIAIAAAGSYYAFVVAGEVGRSASSIFVTGAPAALCIVWFRTRPLIAMSLAAGSMLLLASAMVNGYFVSNVVQQSAVLLAIFGGALSSRARDRVLALGLAVLTVALAITFSTAQSDGMLLAAQLTLLPFIAFGLGLGARLLLTRADVLGDRLAQAEDRGAGAARDAVIEQERIRVAREVHDVVAHSLAVVVAQADGARYALVKDPRRAEPALDAIADTARTALGDVRTLLHELRDERQPGPPPDASDLDSLIDGFGDLGLRIEVDEYGSRRMLSGTTALALHRIVQEALTNALRHGDAAEPVTIDLDWGERAVGVVVTNAVAGAAGVGPAGHGVPGMRERAHLAGGDFSVGIGAGGRFRIRAGLPVVGEPSDQGPEPVPAPEPGA